MLKNVKTSILFSSFGQSSEMVDTIFKFTVVFLHEIVYSLVFN